MKSENYEQIATFRELGLCEQLIESLNFINWKKPSLIQKKSIPLSLQGKDIIAIAQTGSGKTGAFALPILEGLLSNFTTFYALIVVPNRELGIQILDQFSRLALAINPKCSSLIGGIISLQQIFSIAKRPNILIATPGRIIDHLTKTKGFNLIKIKHLVLDEADRLLSLDFDNQIQCILRAIPNRKKTQLYSSTMQKKMIRFEKICLKDTVIIEISRPCTTVATLKEFYMLVPKDYKDLYLFDIMIRFRKSGKIIFTNTRDSNHRVSLYLRNLGLKCAGVDGKLPQSHRLSVMEKFKAGNISTLVATDVASRGLDIPTVELVINYDVPLNPKDYVHRVGRTAREGRRGRAITLVTPCDVESFRRTERLIGKNMEKYHSDPRRLRKHLDRVRKACKTAALIIKSKNPRDNS